MTTTTKPLLSPAKEQFARLVASSTGLQLPTVRAWIQAEGGPDDNPLNIMTWSASGARSVAHYGDATKAAKATTALLQNNRYAAVRTAAANPSVADELEAIAVSPWDENNYRGTTRTVGNLLLGAYRALYNSNPSGATTPASSTSDGSSTQTVSSIPPFKPPIIGTKTLTGWMGDLTGWVGEEAAKALAYYVLTSFALFLIAIGTLRSFGVSPAGFARTWAPSKSSASGAQSNEIPF